MAKIAVEQLWSLDPRQLVVGSYEQSPGANGDRGLDAVHVVEGFSAEQAGISQPDELGMEVKACVLMKSVSRGFGNNEVLS